MLNQILRYSNLTKNFRKIRLTQRYSSTQVERAKPVAPQILDLKQGIKFSPGRVYDGFLCTTAEYIKDFNMTAYFFVHETVGTEYLHIDRNDSNNVFSLNFRTTPFDSTGIPHILEHTVLCGSDKFPVRDPFFKMINRSLATFMNAMTAQDCTFYPFSSMNEVDYRNLQKIYMDAVFRPNLRYIDFLQEGWRLEHTNLNEKNSQYVLKGVVYNEMKGAFSENNSVFGQKFLNKILPDHTYGHVSGGDPLSIPNLTHANLVQFHERYYHPSNCRIFSYGNNRLEPTLKYLNETYMKDFMKIDTEYSKIPPQKRWNEPKSYSIVSRFDSMGAPIEKQNQIAIGYLMSDITDIYETFVMSVITELLVRGPNSYFYKSLIEPNISGGYNQHTGFDNQIKDTLFIVGLQDLLVDDFQKVEHIFDETITEVIANGFEKNHIESVLHNYELQLKHQTPKFGLGLLMNLTPLWNHEGDLITAMKVSELIQQLRTNMMQNSKYLQEKVEFYFRKNNHRMTMTMRPDPEYENNFNQLENEVLKLKIAELTADDKDKVFRDGIVLSDVQKATENIEVLPCLKLEDIPKTVEKINLVEKTLDDIPLQYCITNTNDVTYFRGIFDASNLSPHQKLLLPLFTAVINQFGTTTHSYCDFDQLVQSKTSGINFSLNIVENLANNEQFEIGVKFGSYSLSKNTDDMFKLIQDLLFHYNLHDIKRFEMLLENYLSSLACGIVDSGHMYAMQCASGLVTESAKLKEALGGIEHINFMKNLIKTKSAEQILAELRDIGKLLFDKSKLRAAINVDDGQLENVETSFTDFIKEIPKIKSVQSSSRIWNPSAQLKSSNIQHVMNIPVNYCAKSIFTVPHQHEDHAPLKILAKVLSAKYLLPVVREQNGAYGAGAKIGFDGLFNFFSYRDPNSIKTLDTFDNAAKWFDEKLLATNTLTDQILFEAKLGVLQQIDVPLGPGDKGMDNFKYGLTQDSLTQYRNHVLTVTKDELNHVNDKYLKDTKLTTGRSVLGPENGELKPKNWVINKVEN